jgi:hypothetical protein
VNACPHGIASRWACQQCSAIDDALAQLRQKFEALELRVSDNSAATVALVNLAKGNIHDRLDAALKRVEQLELVTGSLLDRVNQLVEFHGIRPIVGDTL